MEVDCWLVRMEWCPSRLFLCLPFVMLCSTMKSRRDFLLAPAHVGGPRKRAVKRFWWCGGKVAEVGKVDELCLLLIHLRWVYTWAWNLHSREPLLVGGEPVSVGGLLSLSLWLGHCVNCWLGWHLVSVVCASPVCRDVLIMVALCNRADHNIFIL